MPEPAARPIARLFLALWPDDRARGALAAWRDRWTWPATAEPVPDRQLHLTLHYIGPVASERVDEVAAGLAVTVMPFGFDRGHAERWRNGIAAWCPDALPQPLVGLHQRLALALRALHLPVEQRPFRAHVTLARGARGATAPAEPPALVWSVRDYALVRSQAGYRVLRRCG